MWVVGALDDGPCLGIEAYCLAPCERLEADAQVPTCGTFRQLVELGSHTLLVGDEARRGIRAHEHQRCAQRLHDIELPLRAIEVLLEQRIGRALEVPKRLIEIASQP